MKNINSFADYVYDIVKKICTKIGPYCPCTPQERKRAMIFKEEMEKFTDSAPLKDSRVLRNRKISKK